MRVTRLRRGMSIAGGATPFAEGERTWPNKPQSSRIGDATAVWTEKRWTAAPSSRGAEWGHLREINQDMKAVEVPSLEH